MKRKYVTVNNLDVVYENVDKAYEYLERALEDLALMGLTENDENTELSKLVNFIDITKLSSLKNLIELNIEESEIRKSKIALESIDEKLCRLREGYLQYSKDLIDINSDCFIGVGNCPEHVVFDDLKEFLHYKDVKFQTDINLIHIFVGNHYMVSVYHTDFEFVYQNVIREVRDKEEYRHINFVNAYLYFIKGEFDLLKSNINKEDFEGFLNYMEIKLSTLGEKYRRVVQTKINNSLFE